MKRNALILAAVAICMLPAIASAQSRGGYGRGGGHNRGYSSGHGGYSRGSYGGYSHSHYGGYRYRAPRSGFTFSFGLGGYGGSSYYNFGAAYGRPFYGYGNNYYYNRPYYYRPAVTRYYDDYCYTYRPAPRYYSHANYYYVQVTASDTQQPTRPSTEGELKSASPFKLRSSSVSASTATSGWLRCTARHGGGAG